MGKKEGVAQLFHECYSLPHMQCPSLWTGLSKEQGLQAMSSKPEARKAAADIRSLKKLIA